MAKCRRPFKIGAHYLRPLHKQQNNKAKPYTKISEGLRTVLNPFPRKTKQPLTAILQKVPKCLLK